jgi:fructosamine-3-kinase
VTLPADLASIPEPVRRYALGSGLGDLLAIDTLQGGIQSRTRRLAFDNGTTLVLKQHDHAPADWYAREVEGLSLLDQPGCPRVPKALAIDQHFLLLEDLRDRPAGKSAERTGDYWEAFGRSLAKLHRITGEYYGFAHNNYLGLMPQRNTPTHDGHAFFIEHRVLRYLNEPIAIATLTPEDRRGVERLCDRIRRDVPHQPPSLCHGDLWVGNMLIAECEAPSYVDPAVHYGWAEAELSLTRQFEGVPESFYAAYVEVNALNDGWQDRLPLYELKEMLALIAQFADEHDMLRPLRALVAKYA